jgi:hypothetical protein
LETKFAKLLEMRSFFPPHIIFGVGKQRDLENKICQTVGDALRASPPDLEYLVPLSRTVRLLRNEVRNYSCSSTLYKLDNRSS